MANKLYLVDGTSQLYRAYFAIRGLATRGGLPTNAVYGFTTMLRKLLAEEQPDHIAIAFDSGRKVFRHEQFADYKAHRPPTPDDLKVQIPYAKQVCLALGVPLMELEGFEADDLIATYTERARRADFEVVVVASDKDLYQLVGEGVTVLNPSKNERLDAEGVARSFGVPPELVRDVLGLMGDSVDNIPGVPGVGPKTALAAVSTYGSLEAVLDRAERFSAAFEARDVLLGAIDAPADEARIREAAHAFCRSVETLLEIEADPEQRAKLTAAAERMTAGVPPPAKLLPALKRELKALDRGSSRRIWSAIRDHAEQARLSRELATLHRDAPLGLDLQALARSQPDRERAATLFRALEFRALAAELEGSVAAVEPATTHSVVENTVLTREQLQEVVRACRNSGRIALAVETAGGGPQSSKLVGFAVALDAGRAHYVPLDHVGLLQAELGPLLADPACAKVAHDQKTVTHVLRRHGLPVCGFELDTMVAAFLLDPGRSSYALERVASELTGREPSAAEHAAGRAGMVLGLAALLESRLASEGLSELYRTIDGPLLPLLARMEAHGIRIDTRLLERMSLEMESAIGQARTEIHVLAGEEFNVDSPKQLRQVLFSKLELKTRRKTAKGREASTDAQTLEELSGDHPIASKILEYRELAKLKGTYVDALPRLVDKESGRVHTSYHPTGAATGRLSSSDPNLQNIPARTEAGRKIRAAFVPQDGWVFLASDYSQIELRVLAHMTGDPELIAAFRRGEDIHRHTAARVFGVLPDLVTSEMRQRAKVVNFGVLYGMSETRLAREQGIPRSEARRFIAAYFARFVRVREYIDAVREQARGSGIVRTLFGRLRRFPQLSQRVNRAVQEQALRAAVNTTVQGTAADLMKLSMLAVERAIDRSGLAARILLQVHDELLLEVPAASVEAVSALVREAMEGVRALDVPLVVDQKVGKSWMEVT